MASDSSTEPTFVPSLMPVNTNWSLPHNLNSITLWGHLRIWNKQFCKKKKNRLYASKMSWLHVFCLLVSAVLSDYFRSLWCCWAFVSQSMSADLYICNISFNKLQVENNLNFPLLWHDTHMYAVVVIMVITRITHDILVSQSCASVNL